jgi:glycosyltransferase involved in cell wall biosynthesis
MRHEPRVSFLIPVRDARSSLEACLRSALAQTEHDFEIVVVDDGSEDESAQLAEGLGDSRIRVFRRPRLGIVAALEFGRAQCRGDFIARLDADDTAAPERLEKQLPFFEDPLVAVVDGQMRWEGDVQEGMRLHAEWINRILHPDDFARLRFRECGVVHPAATLRRSALDEYGGYREGDFPEDFELWLRLLGAGLRFHKVPEPLVTMREHEARATRVDPRYRREAFRRVAGLHLAQQVLVERERILLWGAGRGGRPWLRFLLEQRRAPIAVLDIDPKKIGSTRQGVPVRSVEELPLLDAELLLVAVGRRDALALIRPAIARLRPEWQEGEDWFALVCG